MNVNTGHGYYLNMQKFGDLFTDTPKIETLEQLKTSAAKGDQNCIEVLGNIALRKDEYGKLAEKILFELFCGESSVDYNADVINHVQDAALKLYRLSENERMQNHTDMHKLRTPSKLLYMAGSAVKSGEKLALSRLFNQKHNAHSQYEQIEECDIWDPSRMITTDEINTALNSQPHHYGMPSINFPIGLINPHSHENMLSQQIITQSQYNTFLEHAEFFPVNTGNHWITFGLYQSDDGQRHAVICNTSHDLSAEVIQHLTDSANLAGVMNNNIHLLQTHIQEYMPNGCGLLTIEAMKLLIEHDFQSPVQVLQDFLFAFPQKSIQEQEQYNLHNRYHLYANTYLS